MGFGFFSYFFTLVYIIYAFYSRLALLAFNSFACVVRVSFLTPPATAHVYRIEKFSLQSARHIQARKYAKKYATQKSLNCKVLTIEKFAWLEQCYKKKKNISIYSTKNKLKCASPSK